jgi:hypothetical protein
MNMRGAAVVLVAVALASACREAHAPSRPVEPLAAQALPDGLHWMRNSAEYRALAHQAWRAATRGLPSRVVGRATGSWHEQCDKSQRAERKLLSHDPPP